MVRLLDTLKTLGDGETSLFPEAIAEGDTSTHVHGRGTMLVDCCTHAWITWEKEDRSATCHFEYDFETKHKKRKNSQLFRHAHWTAQ